MRLEKDIEKYLKNQVEKLGGIFYKFTSPAMRGVPDRIVIYDGQVVFAELKRSLKVGLSPLQIKQQSRIRDQGMHAIVIRTYLEALDFVEDLKNGKFRI